MKINYKCLPCLVNQVIKVADMTNADNIEVLLKKVFHRLGGEQNPHIKVFFAVRGMPVVNDSIEADAYFVGINEYAEVISNGDNSLGTVVHRVSDEFKRIYMDADIIIAKGQANYESLSEEYEKNIYFLLVAKCDVIAKNIGVPIKSFICMNQHSSISV